MSSIQLCSKSESSIRVVRVKLNDGERVVGIRYPQTLIANVEDMLKEQTIMEHVQHAVRTQNHHFFLKVSLLFSILTGFA